MADRTAISIDADTEAELERMDKGFMQPQVYWDTWDVDESAQGETTITRTGTNTLAGGSVRTTVDSWGGRLSAPEYMACTDWILGDTAQQVADDLVLMYGDE